MNARTLSQPAHRSTPGNRNRAVGSLAYADLGRIIQVPGYGEGILWSIEHVAAIGDNPEPWTRLILRKTWHGTDEATRGLPPDTKVSVPSDAAVAAARGEEQKVLGFGTGGDQ